MNELEAARAELDKIEQMMLEGGELAIAELREAHKRARFKVEQMQWRPAPRREVPDWLMDEWRDIRFLRRSWLSPEQRAWIIGRFGIGAYWGMPK